MMIPNSGLCLILVCLNFMFSSRLFAGACVAREEGSAEFHGISNPSNSILYGRWDGAQPVDYPGATLLGGFGSTDGSDRVYSGPAQLGTFSLGPYQSFSHAEQVIFTSSIEFSTNWSPTGHERCVNHKYKTNGERICVERATFLDPTSFAIVVTRNENGIPGTPIFTKIYENLNHINHGQIQLPEIMCEGELLDLEVQVRDFRGGSLTFLLHNLHIDARWRFPE